MQNILEILKELEIEVPEGKEKSLTKKVSENYKTVSEHDKRVKKLEEERDQFKEQYKTAKETLDGFEGKDIEAITKERDEWKEKAKKAETEYKEKIASRDYSDAVSKAVEGLKFSSNAAKKAFVSELEADPLKMKDGKLLGFDDYVKAYQESDASAFVSEEDEKNKENAAKFTEQTSVSGNTEPITGDPNKMDFATYKQWRNQKR